MNDVLEKARTAINEVFGDTTVSKIETVSRLEDLQSYIETMLDALESDIRREES